MNIRLVAVGTIASLVSALSPAIAADLGAPAPEPVVMVPAPMVQSYDWSGPYAGAQLGWGWADASPDISGGDEWLGGVHGGYRWDFGTWVLGGELEYNWTDIDLRGTTEDTNISGIFNVKAIAGMEAGPALVYATLGWSQAQADGNYDSLLAGLGLAYPFRDNWVASGEWLYYAADDYGLDEASSAWANTLTLRMSYRF